MDTFAQTFGVAFIISLVIGLGFWGAMMLLSVTYATPKRWEKIILAGLIVLWLTGAVCLSVTLWRYFPN